MRLGHFSFNSVGEVILPHVQDILTVVIFPEALDTYTFGGKASSACPPPVKVCAPHWIACFTCGSAPSHDTTSHCHKDCLTFSLFSIDTSTC